MRLSLGEVVASYERSKAEGKVYPTGFPWLDNALGGGILCHDVMVLGALDNVGKSRWCLSSALYRAHIGQYSLYVSVEDSPYKVGSRVAKALEDLPVADEHISCVFHPTDTDSVCHSIRTCDKHTSMVYVDYIQDLAELDHKVIKRNLKALKQAVSERDAALVVTSQVTERRDSDGNLLFPPNRFWLRGARELSQKPDSVVMLWPGEGKNVNAVLDKNKDGDVGVRAVMGPWYGGRLLDKGVVAATLEDTEVDW